eukprot:16428241-Heterocapsa_arctica.AAC.1
MPSCGPLLYEALLYDPSKVVLISCLDGFHANSGFPVQCMSQILFVWAWESPRLSVVHRGDLWPRCP